MDNSLAEAVRKKDLNSVLELLKQNQNVNLKDSLGNTPLILAVKSENLEMVRLLLEHTSIDLEIKGELQRTALMWAISWSNLEVTSLLLKKGAKVNARGLIRMTPLIYAMNSDDPNLEIVKLLIDYGANVNDADSNGETSLRFAIELGWQEAVQLLVENGAPIEHPLAAHHHSYQLMGHLFLVAFYGHFDILNYLLTKGFDIDAKDEKGRTLLMIASQGNRKGHLECVKLLIELGANPKLKDDEDKDAKTILKNLINTNKENNNDPNEINLAILDLLSKVQ
ncbi:MULTISPECIES: ankyrin repeat domain-containing protein [Leptospira]|uniref:Uncharacterized protein n=2 Tax=Leptospira santarosai TaxID=28183 RepID=K8XUJ9_9LEPT|nr:MULTISPECIES: ankyrin repeat domain-containing protein [Leptospira]AVV78177.1 Ankyrin repeat protein [Leptospira santarosai]EKO79403.1 ankyrin repeat protein [Leptospira sp. Fiocruz LV3954]EKT85293.1 hypothetical protein LSS_18429 [Leptospira santarosai serovar Shermani str. LT 821]EMI66288.1 ankyrin repeat protein [Leptospira sp. Fiocruz LV4135]EPG81526.1 ankyrin repeat protein [Leptospira santarosai serovar Shermani str. 1342KT]